MLHAHCSGDKWGQGSWAADSICGRFRQIASIQRRPASCLDHSFESGYLLPCATRESLSQPSRQGFALRTEKSLWDRIFVSSELRGCCLAFLHLVFWCC